MELVTAVLALTATVERGVTFLRSLKMLSWVPGNWWPIFAMAGGAIFCLGWQINLTSQAMVLVPALADNTSKFQGLAGQVLTGLTVGALAGPLHELVDRLRGAPSKSAS